jgi:hypothetical protein
VDSLFKALAPFIGQPLEDSQTKLFTQHTLITGFNNRWRLPRPSSVALVKGSVISSLFTGPKADPQPWPFFFGSGGVEGYGRIHLNPLFLNKDIYEIKAQKPAAESNPVFSRSPKKIKPFLG